MIDLKGMISINLLKKEVFTGSDGKLRYRLHKQKEAEEDVLTATYWIGPYCFDATSEEDKISKNFEFTKEGIGSAADWLNTIVENGD